MARQKLGAKKHKRCEDVAGKKYDVCLVRGGSEHFWACCVYNEDGISYSDWVNYRTREVESDKRKR